MQTLKLLVRISRPHFWLYELGTFFLGVAAGAAYVGELAEVQVLVWGLYFLFPANLLIYGINDVFDYETDILNQKKQSYESVLPKEKHRLVLLSVVVTSAPFLFFTAGFTSEQLAALGAFWFFAALYSAPPIRAKARPFLDSVFSAGHYVATGVFGYFLVAPAAEVPYLAIVGAMAWAMAMHAYSAVPDIAADAEAGLATTATVLSQRRTILYCLGLYTIAAIVAYMLAGLISVLLYLPYVWLLVRSYNAEDEPLLQLYSYFPYLNALVGMSLCFVAFYQNGWL